MKPCLLIVTFCMTASVLCAQNSVVRSTKKGLREAVEPSITKGTISRYGGTVGTLMGVDFHLTQAALKQTAHPPRTTILPSTQSLPMPQTRSWLTQQTRNFKAWQLKQNHRKQIAAHMQAELDAQAIEQAKAALPPLMPEKKLIVDNFEGFIAHPDQPKPVVPFVAELGKIAYRGIALGTDGKAVANILKNGLRLQDLGKDNNNLRMTYAGQLGYGAMKHISKNPVTNITDTPESAEVWGTRRMTPDFPILTLVKIRGEFAGDPVEVLTEDIPATDIEEVVVRLNIDGTLTWCKVQLNQNNTFTLIPYAPYPQK